MNISKLTSILLTSILPPPKKNPPHIKIPTKFKLILLLPLIYLASSSSLFFFKGNNSILNSEAHLFYTIPIQKPLPNVKINLYQFQSFTNGINKQFISDYSPKISPKPSSIQKITDSLNNKQLQISFSNIQSPIRIESKFIFNNELDIFSLDNYYEYPLPPLSIKHVKQFLNSTPLTTPSYKIQKLAQLLSKNAKNQFQAVISTLSWIKNNIAFQPKSKYSDSRQTFFYSSGSRSGILNLTLTLLRLLNIPSRFVHGISFNESLTLKKNHSNLEIQYPKSLYSWIEIYFPNQDWVSFDPLLSYFFVPSQFLRQNIGLDSSKYHSVSSKNNQKLPLQIQFFVNISKSIKNIHIQQQSYPEMFHNFLLTPMFSSNYQNWFINQYSSLFHPTQPTPPPQKTITSLKPNSLSFNHVNEYLDLKVSPNSHFYQKIYLHKPYSLKSIQIPLFLFRNHGSGQIWLELFQHSPLHKNPVGNLIKTSKMIPIRFLLHHHHYSWVSFPFPHTPLKKGAYWFSLKHATQEIILWRAIFSNPFLSHFDTLYSSNHSSQINFIFLDLAFQINLK